MSDDALAALLDAVDEMVKAVPDEQLVSHYWTQEAVGRLREAYSAFLRSDHPLRTGEPSEAMKLAFIKAHVAIEGEWLPTEKWEEALDAGLRAAIAMLYQEAPA